MANAVLCTHRGVRSACECEGMPAPAKTDNEAGAQRATAHTVRIAV